MAMLVAVQTHPFINQLNTSLCTSVTPLVLQGHTVFPLHLGGGKQKSSLAT